MHKILIILICLFAFWTEGKAQIITLDNTYNNSGTIEQDYTSTSETTLGGDGSLYMHVRRNGNNLEIIKYDASGVEDLNFASNVAGLKFHSSISMEAQSNGKLLIFSRPIASPSSYEIIRINTDGTLDQTFANSGKLVVMNNMSNFYPEGWFEIDLHDNLHVFSPFSSNVHLQHYTRYDANGNQLFQKTFDYIFGSRPSSSPDNGHRPRFTYDPSTGSVFFYQYGIIAKVDNQGNLASAFGTNGQLMFNQISFYYSQLTCTKNNELIVMGTGRTDSISILKLDMNTGARINNFGTNGSVVFNYGKGRDRMEKSIAYDNQLIMVLARVGYFPSQTWNYLDSLGIVAVDLTTGSLSNFWHSLKDTAFTDPSDSVFDLEIAQNKLNFSVRRVGSFPSYRDKLKTFQFVLNNGGLILSEKTLTKLDIFPNPVLQNGSIMVKTDELMINGYQLFSTDGTLLQESYFTNGKKEFELFTQQFPKGMYMLHVNVKNGEHALKKFIIQ